ncbi:MAG: RNA polymerase sigma-54 factor, partial [Verrucomicrobia bacterium]|nr:RNA polymerase sigma-54 factor [Verrucomicrobiota bacterium]
MSPFAFFQALPNPKMQTMSLSLQPSLRQTTSISPQIQQSLQLLQTPALELQNLLQTELQTNPVLEEEMPPLESAEPGETPETGEDSDSYPPDSDWPTSSARPNQPRLDPRQALLESKVLPESLTDHLHAQLSLTSASHEVRAGAEEIIGNLDEDGFLRSELPEIAVAAKISLPTAGDSLALVQSFHPAGVAARNLSEALLLQLAARGQEESLEARIVRDHLDLLGRRKF